MSLKDRMAQRPYLDGMREACEQMTREQLISFILELGQEIAMEGRSSFLAKLRSFSPRSLVPSQTQSVDAVKAMLERLTALREEIEQRIASIEEGTYWDDDRNWDGSDDEDPEYVTSEQADDLAELLVETGDLFAQGRFLEARGLYEVLFDLLNEHHDVTYIFSDSDLHRAHARYCRAVYETAEPGRRMEEFVQSMRIDAPDRSFHSGASCETHPLLEEVMEASPDDMPHLESFLPAWEKRLADFSSRRSALLRLEAVEKLRGLEGISQLCRAWKSDQPCGYLHWIGSLDRRGDFSGMISICREALDNLPHGPHREQAADLLATAASRLGNSELVLLGKRERFLSAPDEDNLMELLAEAEEQQVRSEELEAILASPLATKQAEGIPGNLRVKMQLMAGRLEDALDECHDAGSLGWSYGETGVLFGGVLCALTAHAGPATIVQELLKRYTAGGSHRFDRYDLEPREGKDEVTREVLLGLSSVGLSRDRKQELLVWAERLGCQRVEAIVSSQSRGAYDRAAQVLGALAECRVCMKTEGEAASLVREFVQVKFPRHTAFRKEVKRVVESSDLLKPLRIL